MRNQKIHKRIIALLVVIGLVIGLCPITSYAEGDEAGEDWIEIRTATDLYNVRNNLSGNYKLMNDIDLTEVTASGGMFNDRGRGWRPIGENTNGSVDEFSGVFDGQGYTIKGLQINKSHCGAGSYYAGLFSYNTGTIKNLVLSEFKVIGSEDSDKRTVEFNRFFGSLAGYNTGNLININVVQCNVSFSASVYYDGTKKYKYNIYYLGNVVGVNAGTIETTNSIGGNVSLPEGIVYEINGGAAYLGGIAGGGSGNFINCFNSSYISATGDGMGRIYRVCESGICSGTSTKIDGCVNSGTMTSLPSGKYNGFSSISTGSSTIRNSYSTIGLDLGGTSKYCSYYKNGNSIYMYNANGQGISLNENQTPYTMFYEGFDFDNTWILDDRFAYKLPMLRNTYNGDVKTEITPELSIEGWTYGESPNEPEVTGNTGEGTVTYEYKVKDAEDDTFTKDVPTEAGEYTLRATIEETEYYNGTELTCDFEIEPKEISVSGITANDKEYDGLTDAKIDCSSALISGLIVGDEISVEGSGTFIDKNAGDGKAVLLDNLKLVGDKAQNYVISDTLSQKEATANITQKSLKVTADDISKTYGEKDPELTYSTEGLVKGEDASSVASGKLVRTAGENTGSYDILQGTLKFGNNYAVTFTGGTFVISKAQGDQTKPASPVLSEKTNNMISVNTEVGYEYSIDAGKTWNTTGIFEGLKCSTSYSIVTRKAATDNVNAGVISDALGVRTNNHNYSETVISEATCEDSGLTKYVCSCGDTYTDEIPALGHDYEEIEGTASEPKCTEDGKYADKICKNCGEIIPGATINQLGHKRVKIQEKAPTCTSSGRTEGWYCSRCGDTLVESEKIEPLGHDWDDGEVTVSPTCTKKGTKTFRCKRIGCNGTKTEAIDAIGHTVVVDKGKKETCTEAGLTDGSHCSVCNAIIEEQRVIPAAGHKEVIDEAVPPTCLGTGLTEGSHCSVCGITIKEQEEVAPKGHSWDKGKTVIEASCTKSGVVKFTCVDCDASRTEIIQKKDHTVVDDTGYAATCTDEGLSDGSHCSVCGSIIKEQTTIPALGHSYDEGIVTKEPNCTESGEKIYTCLRKGCSHTKTETIKALGHSEVIIPAVEPTCTEKGTSEGKRCTVCNVITVKPEEVPALGHDYDDGTIVKAATCTEDGEKIYTCKRNNCNETKTEIIKAKGHSEVAIPAVEPTCTEAGNTEGKKCTVCNKITQETERVAPLGHDWDDGKITKEPTCVNMGIKTFTCSRCSEIQTEYIAAKGHSIVVDPEIPATKTSTGLTEGSHCSTCGMVFKKQNVIPKIEDPDDKTEEEKKAEEEAKKKAEEETKKKSEGESNKTKYSNEWVNGKWYDANGNQTYSGTLQWKANVTGWWIEDTDGWYPTDSWQKIDGIWYFFKPDGYMASNEYYNGYWFNSDGSWDDKYLLSWKSNSTGWWVEDISGWWPSNSWLKIDGDWYYFDASGYMVTSQYVDGWWIGSDGVCR
ncbi:MAG: hypothetical protein K5865_05385 [Eubacterium sp.]|nr:hypothetical protein [Eubacterium sp.]